jgi:TolB protein
MKTKKHSLAAFCILVLATLFGWGRSGEESPGDADQSIPLDGRGGGIIAYSVTYRNSTNQIFLINADGSGNKPIGRPSGRPLSPVWSPDARRIAYYNHLSDQMWALFVMDADGGNSRQLTNGQNTLDWSPSWSPDGKQILFSRSFTTPTWRSEIWILNPDGGHAKRIGNMDGQGADWSPDGTKILYFNYVDGGGDIWLMADDGTNVKRLTSHGAEDWWPNWSADGRKIIFQSKRDGNFEIYSMNPDGSNLARLTNNNADDEEPRWSPDGSKIAFSSLRGDHYEIYVMNADGSDQKRITRVNGQAINPDWKPLQ